MRKIEKRRRKRGKGRGRENDWKRRREEEEGVPLEGTSLRPYLLVSVLSYGTSNVPLLVQNKERVHKICSFDRGSLPPLST